MGARDSALQRQIERALGMLLRYRWDPGPTHLLADAAAAHGGMPGSPTELLVRNDFVQPRVQRDDPLGDCSGGAARTGECVPRYRSALSGRIAPICTALSWLRGRRTGACRFDFRAPAG